MIFRILFGMLMVAGPLWGASVAGAQTVNYPTRPIILQVPWPAGGSTDIKNSYPSSNLDLRTPITILSTSVTYPNGASGAPASPNSNDTCHAVWPNASVPRACSTTSSARLPSASRYHWGCASSASSRCRTG